MGSDDNGRVNVDGAFSPKDNFATPKRPRENVASDTKPRRVQTTWIFGAKNSKERVENRRLANQRQEFERARRKSEFESVYWKNLTPSSIAEVEVVSETR